MLEPPGATQTFLFTDIEGSTRLWENTPDAMRSALLRHDSLAEEILVQHDGHLVKSRGEGDSLFVVFENAANAILAACALQQAFATENWAGGLKLRARMALHSGNAQFRDGDYYGPTINRCARLRAVAHGGQIVISQSVYDSVAGVVSDSITLRDMGRHRLKDLQQPEQVYQVCHPALPQDFPALLSLNYLHHNLPVQTTSFIGREKESDEVKRLLEQTSALTLVGVGGCGKSRLALHVGADRLDHLPDGVWYIDLAIVTDPSIVVQSIAAVLNVREEPDKPLLQSLSNYLRLKSLLLLLDNCEHLVASCADLVETLLRSCPKIKIVASSRERLGVSGERVYMVPSLPLPLLPSRTGGVVWEASDLMVYASIRLFCERACQQQPTFTLSEANGEAVAQICCKLDGIPLALELAAARIRALPPNQILARLDDRFRLLTGGARTALPRQQTLQAMLDWSYDLLNPLEQILLKRLAIFAGGWTLEAAEEVCGDEEPEAGSSEQEQGGASFISPFDVLDLLASLVDKSLVAYVQEEEGERYHLLETIRQYARSKKEKGQQVGENAKRHIAYYLRFAQTAEPHLKGPEQAEWLAQLEREHDNLRAALSACLVENNAHDVFLSAQGLAICAASWWFWHVRGYLREGRVWLERALNANPVPTEARAAVLRGMGTIAWRQNDLVAAEKAHREALEIHRASDNPLEMALTLQNIGNVFSSSGNYAEAAQAFEECARLYERLGDRERLAVVWNNLGWLAQTQGHLSEARRWYEASLQALKQQGDRRSQAVALYNLAELALEEATFTDALALLSECLTILLAIEEQVLQVYAMQMLSTLFLRQGRCEEAARVWGSAEALRETTGAALTTEEAQILESEKHRCRETIGDSRFTILWLSGRAMTPEQVVASTLATAQ